MFYSKCTWDRFMKLTAGIVAVIFFLIAAALAITVPSLPASMGNRAGLPSGSLYFWKGEWTGTWYKSGISSGTPSALSAIPAGGRIDISDDGKWLLHGGGSNKLTLFKSNGIYVMDVPVAVFQGNDGVPFCFYRRSPVGTPAGTLPQSKTEIFFASDAKIGKAIVVDLSTNPPTFGSTREVIRFNNPPNGCGFGEYCTDYTMHVSYNHAYAGNSSGGIGWLKIPNNGMGVGSEANVYKDYSGCDYAMTIDGKYCSQNSNNDHTKMPVFPFMELPRIIDDLDSAYALLTVRKGLMSGPGALTGIWWSYLSFGNDTAFFVRGVGNGWSGAANLKGIYMAHWPTNTWYRLTDADPNPPVHWGNPTYFFDNPFYGKSPVENPTGHAAGIIGGMRSDGGQGIYSLTGRDLGSHKSLPHGIVIVRGIQDASIKLNGPYLR